MEGLEHIADLVCVVDCSSELYGGSRTYSRSGLCCGVFE
jgi:hypothetical protein